MTTEQKARCWDGMHKAMIANAKTGTAEKIRMAIEFFEIMVEMEKMIEEHDK